MRAKTARATTTPATVSPMNVSMRVLTRIIHSSSGAAIVLGSALTALKRSDRTFRRLCQVSIRLIQSASGRWDEEAPVLDCCIIGAHLRWPGIHTNLPIIPPHTTSRHGYSYLFKVRSVTKLLSLKIRVACCLLIIDYWLSSGSIGLNVPCSSLIKVGDSCLSLPLR